MGWRKWLRITGVVLLALILSNVSLDQVAQSLTRLDRPYLAGWVTCFVAMVLVRTVRLRLALSRLGHELTFRDCYAATIEPAFMGALTPGRLGEFSRVGYIHAHGVSMQETVCLVTVERLVDLGILLVFGTGGAIHIFAPAPYRLGGVLVMLAGLLLSFAAIRGCGFVSRMLRNRMNWLWRREPSSAVSRREGLTSALEAVMKRAAMPIYLLGLVCIALNFGQVFLLGKAFGFEADYLVVMFAYTAATLVSLLPVSVGGLGTREAAYIMIMASEGIVKEQALLFSLLDGVVLGIFGLFLLCIPVWISGNETSGMTKQ